MAGSGVEFITMLGGAVAALPLAGRAQQPAMPVIGFLSSPSRAQTDHMVAAFGRGRLRSKIISKLKK